MTKRVLFISPYYPPHRATGHKRAIAFTQGVHGQEDWEVIVLASRALKNDNDDRLNNHIPEGVIVNYGFVGLFRPLIKFIDSGFGLKRKKKATTTTDNRVYPPKVRKPSKQKGLAMPFDQYIWDAGSAVRNGAKLIKKYKPDVIWVNADPWTGFLVADKLSRKFNIPWVADLRDPWMLFKKKFDLKPALTANIIRYYEKRFFKSASKVVLNTATAAEEHRKYYTEIADKFTYIRNAFNENLIDDPGQVESEEVFTFGYYGGFRFFVPSTFILKGFATFVKNCKLTPTQVRLEVRGGVYSDFWDQLEEYGLQEHVIVRREIKADKGIALLRSWDVLLLCVLHDVRLMIPSKFYDYLYARKPVMAVSDNMELNQMIDETKSGNWAPTQDTDKVASLFEAFYKQGKTDLLQTNSLIQPFGFEAQAEKFRSALNEVVSQ